MCKANLKTPVGGSLRHWLAISIISIVVACPDSIARIIYVDHDANGLNDGSSWENAYTFLQDGLSYARSDPNADEVRVAQGTYKPDANSADPNGSGDRYATFELISGASLIGGYAGFGEPDPNIRNIQLYETTLSGDVKGDDEPNFVNNVENSYNVVHISWSEGNAILDGFTITSGNANGSYPFSIGGGICNYSGGKLLLINCTLRNNYTIAGGGVYILYGENQTKIISCLFIQNMSQYNAGALYLYESSPTIIDCIFIQNSGSHGGAIFCYSFAGWPEDEIYSNPTIINSEFIGNKAAKGGAIYFRGECHSTLINCKFVANAAWGGYASGGGAIYEMPDFQYNYNNFLNCTLVGNTANNRGGGFCYYSVTKSALINCILWANKDGSGINERSQIQVGEGPRPPAVSVTFCCIQDDNPDDDYIPFGGLANHNIDDNPRFVRDPNDGGDGWGVGDNDDFGDLRFSFNSPCIDAGDNNSVPVDLAELDNDGNTGEPIPWDLDGRPRIADGDCNGSSIVDMGAYEFSYAYFGDFDNQCDVDFDDLKEIASHWLQKEPLFDIAPPPIGDGIVNFKDLAVLAEHWLEGATP